MLVLDLDSARASVLHWHHLHDVKRMVEVPVAEVNILPTHCDAAYLKMLTASRRVIPSLPSLDFYFKTSVKPDGSRGPDTIIWGEDGENQ